MSASNETSSEFTRPVNAVIARAEPPATAFGPNIVSSRTETATNSSPIRAAAPVAIAVKKAL